MQERRLKVILAKLGLDVHNRGIISVAKMLSNAGMEVVYLGNAMPAEIVVSALQEDADVVGVSCLSGAHITLGKKLMQHANQKGLKDECVFIIGGVFSPDDSVKLKKMGFDAVFLPGSTSRQIVSTINALVNKRR